MMLRWRTMKTKITFSIPVELKRDLDKQSTLDGVSRSELVREALRQNIFLRAFETMQRKMVAHARRIGVRSDEDVFRRLSRKRS
jgi:metal-responsive CopG/Arc/MetJ family transcriptional regulator